MPSTDDAADMRVHAGEAARLLKAISNEKRLLILCLLVERECPVGEINHHVALSQSALSQHLAVLREQGLVQTRRDGQTIWYSLAAGPAERVLATLHSIYCAPDPPAPRD